MPTQAPSRLALPRHDAFDVFAVAASSLLLEIAYTRIVSFKLFYYYTYLIIGLALLGIGSGGVAVAVSARLRRAQSGSVITACSAGAALSSILGYLIAARIHINTLDIWSYGEQESFTNLASLLVVCFALFAPFAFVGVILSTLFGRHSQQIGKIYFADLLGAGLACAVVVFLIQGVGPTRTVMIAAALFALVALARTLRARPRPPRLAASALVLMAIASVGFVTKVDVVVDSSKQPLDPAQITHSQWSPIFRVDTGKSTPLPDGERVPLFHDGLVGSGIHKWNGQLSTLKSFDHDARRLPFSVHSTSPKDMAIVGAAGGHEILASLYYDAKHVDAIELNPVTHHLLSSTYADYSGNIAHNPKVNYVLGDGRSFIERSAKRYDLVWYPAPDSYAASSTASAGAFVLSESYLYTAEAVKESLSHLSNDGILAAQFGELSYSDRPNRTARYLSTVRLALQRRGIKDPAAHVMVATTATNVGASTYSTILVKNKPFSRAEVERFSAAGTSINTLAAQANPQWAQTVEMRHLPGQPSDGGVASKILTSTPEQLDNFYTTYPFNVGPITDDAPYFWNFARLGNVARDVGQPINRLDPESGTGERVLLLLLAIAVLFAVIFLLMPFFAIRQEWKALPYKTTSAIYFSCLGLGFLFFEITLIQRLTLFLGYPTYSLTVTLASVLLFTGVGALLSERLNSQPTRASILVWCALAALTAFYEFALPHVTSSFFDLGLGYRVVVAFLLMAPLGICLGMFMPFGLGAVSRLSNHGREYVAWGWAVNGFASVVGSVLTTLLSMTWGFRAVMGLALAVYALAILVLRRLNLAASTQTFAPIETEPVPS